MVLELENKVTGAGRVLVFFGMIATGKSYLAAAWAKRHGCSYYNSDRVRKELAGLVPESRQGVAVDQGIYSRDFSRKAYDRLLLLAEKDLEEIPGACVVLDGSYQVRDERERVRERLRPKAGIVFVHCVCPEDVMRVRMEQRQRDPQAVSDGRWEIYLQQKRRFEMPDELDPDQLVIINTDKDLDELLRDLDTKMARLAIP
jgi:predicted kinase